MYVPYTGNGKHREYGDQAVVGDQLTVERVPHFQLKLAAIMFQNHYKSQLVIFCKTKLWTITSSIIKPQLEHHIFVDCC